jgi:hypothetical protein
MTLPDRQPDHSPLPNATTSRYDITTNNPRRDSGLLEQMDGTKNARTRTTTNGWHQERAPRTACQERHGTKNAMPQERHAKNAMPRTPCGLVPQDRKFGSETANPT